VHILIATYLILALAIICDDYFVPVLEIICDSLHLSSDVAGATFMAAGMSINKYRETLRAVVWAC
jgi:Ca2+/Na+ antiporter